MQEELLGQEEEAKIPEMPLQTVPFRKDKEEDCRWGDAIRIDFLGGTVCRVFSELRSEQLESCQLDLLPRIRCAVVALPRPVVGAWGGEPATHSDPQVWGQF